MVNICRLIIIREQRSQASRVSLVTLLYKQTSVKFFKQQASKPIGLPRQQVLTMLIWSEKKFFFFDTDDEDTCQLKPDPSSKVKNLLRKAASVVFDLIRPSVAKERDLGSKK